MSKSIQKLKQILHLKKQTDENTCDHILLTQLQISIYPIGSFLIETILMWAIHPDITFWINITKVFYLKIKTRLSCFSLKFLRSIRKITAEQKNKQHPKIPSRRQKREVKYSKIPPVLLFYINGQI